MKHVIFYSQTSIYKTQICNTARNYTFVDNFSPKYQVMHDSRYAKDGQ